MKAPDIGHLLDILDRQDESSNGLPTNPETPQLQETLPECPEISPEEEISLISSDVFQGTPWNMKDEVEPAWNENEIDHEFLVELESILNPNLNPEMPLIGTGETTSDGETQAHWDRCAWYQPIHYFGWDWGIYIRQDCLKRQALRIAWEFRRRNPEIIAKWGPRYLARMLYPTFLKASFFCYFLHEYYHHKVESFGFRLLVTTGATKYLNYKAGIYRPFWGTDHCLEEAMANADIHKRLSEETYKGRLGKLVTEATREYVKESFKTDPPGYRKAIDYLGNSRNTGELRLQSQIFDASLTPRKPESDWLSAPVMMKGFYNLQSNIYEIVPTGGRPILPGGPVLMNLTISSGQLIKVATREKGYQVVPGGKGSHVKLKKPGHRSLTVPGNRRDLSYVAEKLLKDLGYQVKDIPELNKI
jgi:hypothetical protein